MFSRPVFLDKLHFWMGTQAANAKVSRQEYAGFCWKLRLHNFIGSSAVDGYNFLYVDGEQWLGSQTSSNRPPLSRFAIDTVTGCASGGYLAKNVNSF